MINKTVVIYHDDEMKVLMRDLLNKIEDLRQILHRVGLEKGISHPDVINLSQQLDILIVEYVRLTKSDLNQI